MSDRRGGEPERIGDVVQRLLRDLRLPSKLELEELSRTWEELLGVDLCRRCRVSGLKGNVLQVEVDSPALLNELRFFRRDELIESLHKALPHIVITNIRFVHGRGK